MTKEPRTHFKGLRRASPTLALVCAVSVLAGCTQGGFQEAVGVEQSEFTIRPDRNTIRVGSEDMITWNGVPIAIEQLKPILEQTVRMDVEPELMFLPDVDADYEAVAALLKTVKESGVTKFGFVGNERIPVGPPGGS